MEQAGSMKTLAERMKEKAEQERVQTETVFKEQLQTLSSNLTASSQNALCTMSDAMAQEITNAAAKLNQHYRLLSLAFAKKWVSTTLLGIAIYLGMMLAGWTVTKFEERKLERYRTELKQLEQDCQTQRNQKDMMSEAVDVLNKTFQTLRDKTSGVAVVERGGSRFVMLPPDSESGYIVNGRPAIKLKE